MNPLEWIGFAASVIVLVQFTFRGEYRIRAISIIAASVFIVYGVLINAIAIYAMNSALILVHIGFFTKEYLTRKRKNATMKTGDEIEHSNSKCGQHSA